LYKNTTFCKAGKNLKKLYFCPLTQRCCYSQFFISLTYSDDYFGLKFQLELVLNRQVELLEQRAIKNQYLKQNIENSKVLVYPKGY